MSRGDIKPLLIFNPSATKLPSILQKKRWAMMACKTSCQLLSYLEALNKKDAMILIHLPLEEDAITLIKNIRNISLITGIIIMEKRNFYEKAQSFLKEGACHYLAGNISSKKLNHVLWELRHNLLF